MAKRRTNRTNGLTNLFSRLGGRQSLARFSAALFAALVLAFASFSLAIAGIARHRAPEHALAFVPQEGTAIANTVDRALLANRKMTPASIEARMRTALQNQPINPKALRLWATAADLRGDRRGAELMLDRAVGQSRRDMIAQLWSIEFAADRKDMRQVLAHFDIALRTSRKAEGALFPRLALAIRNPEVRDALIPYVKRDAVWAPEFFGYAIRSKTSDSDLVDFFIETGGPKNQQLAAQLRKLLLGRLFNNAKFSEMRRLYRADPSADPARLSTTDFQLDDVDQSLGPLGWQLVDEIDAGADFVVRRQGERPVMNIYANTGVTRVVARKALFLPAGQYQMRAVAARSAANDGSAIGWQMRCLEPLSSSFIYRADNVSRSPRSQIALSGTCQVQLLEILAFGGQSPEGMDGILLGITLDATSTGGAQAGKSAM